MPLLAFQDLSPLFDLFLFYFSLLSLCFPSLIGRKCIYWDPLVHMWICKRNVGIFSCNLKVNTRNSIFNLNHKSWLQCVPLGVSRDVLHFPLSLSIRESYSWYFKSNILIFVISENAARTLMESSFNSWLFLFWEPWMLLCQPSAGKSGCFILSSLCTWCDFSLTFQNS